MSNQLNISLTQAQSDYLAIDCDFPLFVAGPGSGKSYLLGLVACVYVQHSSQASVYVYAPENHHIRTIQVPNITFWLDKFKIKHKGYNSKENMIKIDSPNCGDIYFKPMDNPSAYVGYQSYVALVDELDTMSEEKAEEIWRGVLSRNRQQPDDVAKEYRIWDEDKQRWACRNKAFVFTTPEGYKFCYKTWELSDNEDYKIVRGRTVDNPAVSSKYVKQLMERYPPHVAEPYMNGEFVNMDSLSVYFNYDPNIHDSFEEIQPGENLYIGCDFNVNNTAATVYVKRQGGKEWHAVDEMHGVRDAATLADMIQNRYIGHDITMYPDSTGGNRSNANASSPSAIAELSKKGFRIKAYAHNKNAVVQDRINATNNAFMKGKLFVNQRNCPVTSRCLINQAYDKHGKPDKKSGYDHQNDATTYPIVYELGLRPILFSVPYSFANKRTR